MTAARSSEQNRPVIVVRNHPRACECCGGDDHEILWAYECEKVQRSAIYQFAVSNVICRSCGFVFIAPCYDAQQLQDYYDDFWDIDAVDYDWDKRLFVASRYAVPEGVFVEIGAKQQSAFHEGLRAHFGTIITQDISSAGDLQTKDLNSIKPNSVDVIAHYYVLEHITNITAFLSDAWDKLRADGHMIVEVPDIAHYADDASALIHWEHTNHFSAGTLAQIAANEGFQCVETSIADRSRSFGFVSVFKKVAKPAQMLLTTNEYEQNKRLVEIGVEKIAADKQRHEDSKAILARWIADGLSVVVWGVNDDFSALHEAGAITSDVCVVDIDPRKSSLISGCEILTPSLATDAIKDADAILICARTFTVQILDSIAADYDKTFPDNRIRLI